MHYRPVTALVIAVLLLLCQFPICAQASDELTIDVTQDSGDVVLLDEINQSEQDTEKSDEDISSVYSSLDELPVESQPDAPVEITLTQDWIIEDSEGLITLSPQMSSFTPEDVAGMLGFPGISQPVTIYTNGFQIVIKDSGSLLLQEWDANSAQLCIEGEHPDGLFRVESGGTLELHQVYVKTYGTAVMQCEDASYLWSNANERDYPEPIVIGVKGFEALELFSSPEPLRVYDDTLWSDELAAAHLSALSVYCAVDGVREELPQQLKVVWDTPSQAESLAARQDCVLMGTLLDENDQPIESRFTPELQVIFLRRSPVEITKSAFEQTGAGDWFGDIRFTAPVDYESIVLEVSTDNGESWSEAEGSAAGCKRGEGYAYFYADDDRPQLYRIVVEGGPNAGVSETVILPLSQAPDNVGGSENEDTPGEDSDDDDGNDNSDNDDDSEDDSDDLSGNRGGGTVIYIPNRESEITPTQNETEDKPNTEEVSPKQEINQQQSQTLEQATAPFAVPEEVQSVEPPAISETAETEQSKNQPENTLDKPSEPEVFSSETPKAEQEFDEPSVETLAPTDTKNEKQNPTLQSPTVQIAMAATGVAVCAGSAGMVCNATLRGKIIKWIFRLLRRG